MITEIIYRKDRIHNIVINEIKNSKIGFYFVWNSQLCKWLFEHCYYELYLLGNRLKEKNIEGKLIIESPLYEEDTEFLNSLASFEIKYVNGLNGNFGMFDKTTYISYIFNENDDESVGILCSNSKSFVEIQLNLFDKLWQIARPLDDERKKTKYDDNNLEYYDIVLEYEQIQDEIKKFIKQSRRELLIFSSTEIFNELLDRNFLLNHLKSLLNKNVIVKILTCGNDKEILNEIKVKANLSERQFMEFGYLNDNGKLRELIIISDGKYMLQLKFNNDNQPLVNISIDSYDLLLQEILFEKYWNEIKSLTAVPIN